MKTPYEQGWNAKETKTLNKKQCPYPAKSKEYIAWRKGWGDAKVDAARQIGIKRSSDRLKAKNRYQMEV